MDSLAVSIISGLLRAAIAAGGGYLVQKGILDTNLVQQIAGYSAVIAASAWSWMSKLTAQKAEVKAADTGKVAS